MCPNIREPRLSAKSGLQHILTSKVTDFSHDFLSSADIVVTSSAGCMCMRACVRPSEIVRAITCTFVHGFKND